ncbi:MAG TPA: hypothetical protein VFI02_07390, partial [Armatimonadota bacterium]|nr:hypothetical protein [Armatimonadota bacterium]
MSAGIPITLLLVAGLLLAAGEVHSADVWIEHSAVKVLRDAVPTERKSADLCAARREWESFQIALKS